MGQMNVGPWERSHGVNNAKQFPPTGEAPEHLEEMTDLAIPKMVIQRGKFDLESHITKEGNVKLAKKTQRVAFNEFIKSAPAA